MCNEVAKELREYHATVKGMLPNAASEMEAIKADYQAIKNGLLTSQGTIRVSKNQHLILDENNTPMHFSRNGNAGVTFSEVFKVSPTGTSWANRTDEEKELLIAMGKTGVVHYHPSGFSVIRMQWSGASIGAWTFFQRVANSSAMSHGSYAKLISGSLYYGYLHGANSEWSQCGQSHGADQLGYAHPHPVLTSTEGEVLFCLAGSVLGKWNFDKTVPKWGYFEYFESGE